MLSGSPTNGRSRKRARRAGRIENVRDEELAPLRSGANSSGYKAGLATTAKPIDGSASCLQIADFHGLRIAHAGALVSFGSRVTDVTDGQISCLGLPA